jgi:hypothetical protein
MFLATRSLLGVTAKPIGERLAGGTRPQAEQPAKLVQQRCYTCCVPTAHPRIALTRDGELDEALRRAKPLLGEGKSTAALARELILRGARELHANEGTELDRWLSERHATPAERSTEAALAVAARLGSPDPAKPYAASRALEELRDERL